MGVGTVLEPAVVVTLLFGGIWMNRDKNYSITGPQQTHTGSTEKSDIEDSPGSRSFISSCDALLPSSRSSTPVIVDLEIPYAKWRKREILVLGWKRSVRTPHSGQFRDRWFSRVLRKFPFTQEAFYWALIYWAYQLGRAFTAITLVDGTVDIARTHALQVIHLEQALHVFWELRIQRFFFGYPIVMHWINMIYSFIHIPATIFFLVYLYYHTTTQHRRSDGAIAISPSPPLLYQRRRRTMATCNLLAFVVFTLWPCMPPRLLSDPAYNGSNANEAKSYGFVDTVHSGTGESSVWTTNKFCNQYAAMPSLHFGYALLIGLTIATIPLAPSQRRRSSVSLKGTRVSMLMPGWDRTACFAAGFLYPFTILIAIIATANHFLLDAVAGAMVCGIAWCRHDLLLNLLPLEDWFLWCIRAHFAETSVQAWSTEEMSDGVREKV